MRKIRNLFIKKIFQARNQVKNFSKNAKEEGLDTEEDTDK